MKIETAEFVLSAVRQDQFLRDGRPEVAFAGRSNVGKSSLMNRLLKRRGLARTSGSPGRTRALNYFLVNRRFYFVDLPGFGYAKVSRAERRRWGELMSAYLERPDGARLLVHLVDAKVGATELDRQAAEYFRDLELEQIMVATKIDKVPRSRRQRNLRAIEQALELPQHLDVVPFSSVSGEGVHQLWKGISGFLDKPERTEMT